MLNRFRTNEGGSIAILATLLIGVLAVVMAFCLEAANLYVAKRQNQRSADLANLAAAATAVPVVNNAASDEAVATAANVVALNGFSDAVVATRAGASPADVHQQALFTTVTRNRPVGFGGLIDTQAPNVVRASSVASLSPNRSGSCLASLVGPTNIYGESRVIGPACGVSATTFLYVCGTAEVSLAKANTGYSAKSEAAYLCQTATLAPAASGFTYKATVTDTVATSSAVVNAKAHLATMRSPGWPYGSVSPRALMNPTVPAGTDRTFAAGSSTTLAQDKHGGLTLTSAALRFSGNGIGDPTCASPTTISGNVLLNGTSSLSFASGCYVFAGYVLANGAANTTFATEPGAVVTLVFKQYIQNGSGTTTFPSATYSISGNITNMSGGIMTFGDGAMVFGAGISNTTGTLSFGNGSHYLNGGSMSNGAGTLSFGNGGFYLWGGSIANATDGSMTYGDGPFTFRGGSIISSGNLVFGNGPFYFYGGSLNFSAGSHTRFGIGDVDFYGGSVILGGESMTFGYGGSEVTGAARVSLSGGTLSLTTKNLTARGVTFAFDGGTISWLGVGTIVATAPTSANPLWGHQNLLVMVLGGAFNLYQANNAVDTMSGLIYVPATNASIYGSQTVNYPVGGCFGIVSGVLDIYQKARLNVAPCAGMTIGGTQATPVMVQ